jgi:hypothetical protein
VAAVAARLVGDSLTVLLAAIGSRIHMQGWRDGHYWKAKHGANRARTSASSKSFSSETRRSSTGGSGRRNRVGPPSGNFLVAVSKAGKYATLVYSLCILALPIQPRTYRALLTSWLNGLSRDGCSRGETRIAPVLNRFTLTLFVVLADDNDVDSLLLEFL